MKKFKLKSGDTVKVIAGDNKGSEGKVLQIIKDKDRVIVEGVNLVSKHTKPSAQNPQGGIVKKEASLHISNVMLVEDGVAVRVGYNVDGDTKTRISKKTNK
ncbi:50S ribosomal protein L24 [Polaribacter sp. M15]